MASTLARMLPCLLASPMLGTVAHADVRATGWLTLGGEHRLRYEYLRALDPADRTSSILFVRNLVHGDLRAGDALRLFVQPGFHRALGVDDAELPDANHVDIHQTFAEGSASLGDVTLTARAGRQEMSLGSTRWVSVRDGTNVRRAFDLARVSARGETWSSETFYGMEPALERGPFDDGVDPDARFWGSYWTLHALGERLGVELYYLGRHRHDAEYDDASGHETRHFIGTRVFGKVAGDVEYIVHGMFQSGRVADAATLAWGFAGGLWHEPSGRLEGLRTGVRWDALSGDARPGDARLDTFDPFFPNQTFFSALAAFFPTNMYEIHPIVSWERGPTSAMAGCTVFFRQRIEDAVYAPPGRVLVPGGTSGRFTGAQLALSAEHKFGQHWLVAAEYAHIFAGHALRSVTRGDIDFVGTWITLTY